MIVLQSALKSSLTYASQWSVSSLDRNRGDGSEMQRADVIAGDDVNIVPITR